MSRPSSHRRAARCAAALVAAVVATVPMAPSAHAAPPRHLSFPVEFSYQEEFLTEFCGFEVWFTIEGTFAGLLFHDRAGEITGEFNAQPDTWSTLSSPETGESIRVPFAARFFYDYPEGTDVGDPAVVVATGFYDKLPGISATAGRMVFPDAVVVDVDDGVPIVEYGEPSIVRGHEPDTTDADALICDALAD